MKRYSKLSASSEGVSSGTYGTLSTSPPNKGLVNDPKKYYSRGYDADQFRADTTRHEYEHGASGVGIRILETYNTKHNYPQMRQNVDDENLTRMCKNCKKLFTEAENNSNACCYHKGAYKGVEFGYTLSNLRRWTCCKAETEGAVGCTFGNHIESAEMTGILNTFLVSSEKEQEEVALESGGRSRPKSLEAIGFGPKQTAPTKEEKVRAFFGDDDEPAEKKKKKAPKKVEKPAEDHDDVFGFFSNPGEIKEKTSPPPAQSNLSGPINHEVQPNDTLQGLSLKYGVKIEDIKRANKLFSNNIISRKFLTIPQRIEN